MVLDNIQALSRQDRYLLDGFPRNLVQAQALSANRQEIDKVLFIEIPREELVRRLNGRMVCIQCQAPYDQHAAPPETRGRCDSCGGELYQRPDDTPEALKVRIKVYEDETEPLIEYYSGAGKLVRVEGAGTLEEVAQRLLESAQD
jgi:adenylate kinase